MNAHMPKMNGIDAYRAFKRQNEFQNLPVILMSAQRGGTLRQEAINEESLDCWEKPLSQDFLRETLKSILPFSGSAQAEDSNP